MFNQIMTYKISNVYTNSSVHGNMAGNEILRAINNLFTFFDKKFQQIESFIYLNYYF